MQEPKVTCPTKAFGQYVAKQQYDKRMPFKAPFFPSPRVATNLFECHVSTIIVNDLFVTDHSSVEVLGEIFNGRKPTSGVTAIDDPLFW
jgi:hypothetical protein